MAQLVQAILRNALDDCEDAFVLRAAEMFFRPQKLAFRRRAPSPRSTKRPSCSSAASLHRRWLRCSVCRRSPKSTGSTTQTADAYWERSDRFDTALELTATGRGSAALGEVIARWLSHLLAIDVAVEPLTNCATRRCPGMSDLMSRPRASAMRSGTATISTRRRGRA